MRPGWYEGWHQAFRSEIRLTRWFPLRCGQCARSELLHYRHDVQRSIESASLALAPRHPGRTRLERVLEPDVPSPHHRLLGQAVRDGRRVTNVGMPIVAPSRYYHRDRGLSGKKEQTRLARRRVLEKAWESMIVAKKTDVALLEVLAQ